MIRETNNMDLVNPILQHPEIWNVISDDDEMFDAPYHPELIYYLVNWTDGVVIFHPFRDGMKIHPNILPEKRGRDAFEDIEDCILDVFDMGCRHIYAEIDPSLKHVTWCARRLNFTLIEKSDRHLFVRTHLDG